ncbi:CocE/NonD family hydrolase [Roseibium salinum]|nr:CocE/NonD family hydrolase [Roseibium salinum]
MPATDGLRLAARIWRPEGSSEQPVPAILEYIPYRKRFGTSVRDEHTHKYLAGHGYACIRLDIRGSGESEGVLSDEYLQSELDDGVAALHWIAEQDWCDGNIGMMGISWGGFNALQIAAMQPEPLKAIVTIASSDDRYSDDIHHMGGTLLGDNLSWSSVMFSYNTMPPDPALVGDRWRDMWLERLDHSGLWLKTWLQHQRRDAYWRHGSVCEDYSAIKIPVYAVSGWADGYTNSVFRLMENLDVPRKGLVGPWGHIYPHFGRPGPAIDFLSELLRWWDRWLKGKETGIENDPMICAWMQDSVPPNPDYDYRPGHWASEAEWPSPRVSNRRYIAGPRTLRPEDRYPAGEEEQVELDVQSPATLGLHSGKWCSYANGPDLSGDQRLDDGGGLIFQSEPLEEDLDLLGRPDVELELAADQPVALVAVRLSDMRPDHQVTRISYGMLNLTHRDSRQHPEKLEPGRFYRVRVPLCYIAQRVPRGHRVRLSISTVYWPLAWTPPEPVKLTIRTEKKLTHPACSRAGRGRGRHRVRRTGAGARSDAVGHRGSDPRMADPPGSRQPVDRAEGDGRSRHLPAERYRPDGGGACGIEKYGVATGDFTSSTGETEWVRTLSREDWHIETRTRTRLTSDRENFYVTAELDAYEDGARIRCLSWNETIPRDLV